jgi:hypothetical protein
VVRPCCRCSHWRSLMFTRTRADGCDELTLRDAVTAWLSASDDPLALYWVLLWGAAALLLFTQENWTGPRIHIDAEADGIPHERLARLPTLQPAALDVDGEMCYRLAPCTYLLVMARAALLLDEEATLSAPLRPWVRSQWPPWSC